jgi:hypothetical protein
MDRSSRLSEGTRTSLKGPTIVRFTARSETSPKVHDLCKVLNYIHSLDVVQDHPDESGDSGRTWESPSRDGHDLEERVFHRGEFCGLEIDLFEVEGAQTGSFTAKAVWYHGSERHGLVAEVPMQRVRPR